MKADKILLPELYRKKQDNGKQYGRGSKKFSGLLFVAASVFVVIAGVFAFADIGGNMALNMAKAYLANRYSIDLQTDGISGNPIKGYTLENLLLTDKTDNRDIFSAESLTVRVKLADLMMGNFGLSELLLRGISMDIAYLAASDDEGTFTPPAERLRVQDSHFSSRIGMIDVNDIDADFARLDIDVDGAVNGLPFWGNINMDSLTTMNRSELRLGSGKIIATGEISGGRIDLHMSGEDFDLKEIASLYPSVLSSEDFEGMVNFRADITGQSQKPNFSSSIEYMGEKFYGYPVERASANITYSNERLSVSNIQASVFNVPLRGEIAASFTQGKPASLTVKLDGSETSLDGLDEIMNVPELEALGGKISLFSVNISGTMQRLNGLVSLTAPRIIYENRAFTNVRVQMKLAESDTASVEGKFMFEGAPGYISGNVGSILTTPLMELTAKIAGLDIKRVESMIPDAPRYDMSGEITASLSVKGTARSPVITGEINSPEFRGWGQEISKPSVQFVYSDKTLSISRTEGTLNGMPINITGTITDFPSVNPKLNINATITMTPETLKTYAPGVEAFGLSGTVNAGLKIAGELDNLSVNLLATAPEVWLMDFVTARNAELTTAFNVDLVKMMDISVNVAADSVTAGGTTFTGANATIHRQGDKIILVGLTARSGEGMITGAGTASVSGKEPADFSFMFTDIPLESLADSYGPEVKGKLSGTLKISGSNDNPEIMLAASIPTLKAGSLTVSSIKADFSGKPGNIVLKNARAEALGSEITAEGIIRLTPSPSILVTFIGKNMNVARILREYPSMRGKISGTAGMRLTLSGDSEVFSTDSVYLACEIEAESADVQALLRDMSADVVQGISGFGRMRADMSGLLMDDLSYEANGELSFWQGDSDEARKAAFSVHVNHDALMLSYIAPEDGDMISDDVQIASESSKPRVQPRTQAKVRPRTPARRRPVRSQSAGNQQDRRELDLSNSHRVLRIWGSVNQD